MGGSKKYASSTTSSSTAASNDSSDLQSWNEVPSIAHFCSLFRQAFDLLEFDIQELEESLLLMGSEDDSTQLVQRLVIKLLKGCSNTFTKNITEDNYNTYLRRLFLSKREDAEEDNLEFRFDCKALLDDDIDFCDLSLRNRVRILHQLSEFRLDTEDVFEKLKNLDASSLRVDPLGKDAEGTTYWYFYGTRLYKEEFPKGYSEKKRQKEILKQLKKKKKKEKKKKKKKKSSKGDVHSASSAEEDEAVDQPPQSTWSVACLTLQDWEDLTEKYKNSKKKSEKDLYETLSESFLPEIVKMFAEKEKDERRKLLFMQPKRASSRIERKKQEQDERDRLFAEKLASAAEAEEAYDEKLRIEREAELEQSREERVKAREAMKELRAQRAMERDLKSMYHRSTYDSDEEEKYVTRDPSYQPASEVSGSGRPKRKRNAAAVGLGLGSDDDEDDIDSGDSFEEALEGSPGGKRDSSSNSKANSRTNFTNALLRVGTKSTKDSSLDKPVRKGPGLLLEAAGRSLLQKASAGQNTGNKSGTSSNSSSNLLSGGATIGGLSFGLASSKISFGLYGGHLPVDHATYTTNPKSRDASPTRDGDSNNDSPRSKTTSDSARQKVFSNWGGEFFKKNLDYRANTNKILEKMNLSNKSNGSDGGSASAGSTTSQWPLMKGPGGTAGTLGGSSAAKRPFEASEAANSPTKRLKSSFLNSYS